jgi:hypothetical protein
MIAAAGRSPSRATGGGLRHERADVVFRHRRLAPAPEAEHPEDQLGRAGEQPHDRSADPRQPAHRSRHPGSDRLGVGEREPLGHQLAQHDGEKGDHGDDERERHSPGVGSDDRDSGEQRGQLLRDGRPAERAGEGAHQGDADLDGGEELGGLGGERQRGLGPEVARFGTQCEPGPPGGDHGQLGHGEDAVERQQGDDDEQLDQYPAGHCHLRWAWNASPEA